jgi:hypothetical protein
MPVKWSNVLDFRYNWHGSRDYFFRTVVEPSGYPYFLWNDRVYKVTKNSNWYEETEYTIDDLD